MGNESTVSDYLETLTLLFHQLFRVIKPRGTIVINLGDKYDDGSLMMLPYRFAIKILDHYGSNVRLVNDLTWVKTNPTPRQDHRKLIQATEPFFIFAKDRNYVFNKSEFLAKAKPIKSNIGSGFGRTYQAQIDAAKELTDAQKDAARAALAAAVADVKAGRLDGLRMKIKGVHALAYGGQAGGRNSAIERDGFTIIRLHGEPMKRDVICDELIYDNALDDESRCDVIEHNVETIQGNQHPAVFPVNLIENVLRLVTNEAAIVLDPFMGSGSTALAARNIRRNYIGIEIDPDYHAQSVARLFG
jgi:site-specific DNA-methyltransferase (adenine-specific)